MCVALPIQKCSNSNHPSTPTKTNPNSLDHVPHWDAATAMPYVERSYVKYHMTLDIPDVKCEKVRVGYRVDALSFW